MKTLNRYVTSHFIITFTMAIMVLTFGLVGARTMELFKYIARGVPADIVFQSILYLVPWAFSYTIPWAILVGVMLVFGRLSADNEITAMRACGISILQIISPIIILTFLLTCLCLYLQLDIGYSLLGKARSALKQVAITNPLALLEAGQENEFDRFLIYFAEKTNNNEIKDIEVFVLSKDRNDRQVEQNITASSGMITVDEERQELVVSLTKANVIEYDRESGHPRRIFNNKMSFAVKYGEKENQRELAKRTRFLSRQELLGRLRLRMEQMKKINDLKLQEKTREEIVRLTVELNKRVALALSPIAFLLFGLPMAIRTSRRETSVGLFLSVLFAGVYWGCVIICDSLYSHPEVYPHVILWIPCVLYQVFGTLFIFKIARR